MRRQVNRYALMRKHKRKMKQKFLRHFSLQQYEDSIRMLEAQLREDNPHYNRGRNGGFEYWQNSYLSGKRKFAKRSTNRVIRSRYRDMLRNADEEQLEDMRGLRGSDYEKEFDYAWTIW